MKLSVLTALCVVALAPLPGAGVEATPVPDVLARQAGLRLVPMARPARVYAENCQGCHGEAGRSADEIPALVGRVGYFARVPAGRRYLAQVPNVALNPGSDRDIADLLNWMLQTFSRAQLPADFVPYTPAEVGSLRREHIDPVARRASVVEQLVASGQVPSAEVLALAHPSSY